VKKEVEINKARHEIAAKSRSVHVDPIGSRLDAQRGVRSDREQECQLLRSLAVTFGAAFVLKFVILHGLSAPGDGVVKRGLQER
jgi:hypothetical protein